MQHQGSSPGTCTGVVVYAPPQLSHAQCTEPRRYPVTSIPIHPFSRASTLRIQYGRHANPRCDSGSSDPAPQCLIQLSRGYIPNPRPALIRTHENTSGSSAVATRKAILILRASVMFLCSAVCGHGVKPQFRCIQIWE